MSVGVYTIYYIHFAFVVKYTEETFHKIKLHFSCDRTHKKSY